MTDPREIRTYVRAEVEVEVWRQHGSDDVTALRQERRTLKVSLSEQLDSSAEIRDAFERLAEIAVQGAAR